MKPTGKSRRNLLLNAVLIAHAPLIFAQSADTTTPPALASARAQYKDAAADNTRIYLTKLAQLQAYASRTGDVALAAAVKREIASVVASQSQVANASTPPVAASQSAANRSATQETNDKETLSLNDLKASLVNTTWVWVNAETFTLLPDGKAQWNIISVPTMSWKVVGNVPPVIVGITHSGNKYKMTLDPSLQSGTIDDGDSPERLTARISAKQGG